MVNFVKSISIKSNSDLRKWMTKVKLSLSKRLTKISTRDHMKIYQKYFSTFSDFSLGQRVSKFSICLFVHFILPKYFIGFKNLFAKV